MYETGKPAPEQPTYPPADEEPAHKPSSPQIVVEPVLVRAVEPKTAKAAAELRLTMPGPVKLGVEVTVAVAVLVAVEVAVLVAVLLAVFVIVLVTVLVATPPTVLVEVLVAVLVAAPPDVLVAVTVAEFVAVLLMVGLLVNMTVGVEVAAFGEDGVFEDPHPVIKAIGNSVITSKQPISFFTFTSPEFFLNPKNKYETQANS